MHKKRTLNHLLILIIPVMYFVWSLIAHHLSGPFFLTRCDPEYPYLLNGLACAQFDFSRIGHFDHPGTPFQLLTGIFILLTYFVAGKGALVDDVISRPEFYLESSSLILAIISMAVLYWLGKVVFSADKPIVEALILQSSVLMSYFLIDLPSRYIPDRGMSIIVLLIAGTTYKFIYLPQYSGQKYALQAGVLVALGFISKVNFAPVLVVPFIVLDSFKNRLKLLTIFLLSSTILLLPIFSKLSQTRYFLTSIIKHDGLYGHGNEQWFNFPVFWENIEILLSHNQVFTYLIATCLVLLFFLWMFSKRKLILSGEYKYIAAFVILSAVGLLITAKHFKEYYIIPVVSLTGLTLLVVFKMINRLYSNSALKIFALCCLAITFFLPIKQLIRAYSLRIQSVENKMKTAEFYSAKVSHDDYLLIEPTWQSGPYIGNALVYGLCYIANKQYSYNDFVKIYPNNLTWNGRNKSMRYMQMIEVDDQAILKSGKCFYLLSSPGRNARMLCNYLDSCGKSYNIPISFDTIFTQPVTSEFVIRAQNKSGWKMISETHFEFENQLINTGFESGDISVNGVFEITDEESAHGNHSMKLNSEIPCSPEFEIHQLSVGDFFEITINRRKNNDAESGNLQLSVIRPGQSPICIEQSRKISSVSSYWEVHRLTATLTDFQVGNRLVLIYNYRGANEEFIDDLNIRHFRKSE